MDLKDRKDLRDQASIPISILLARCYGLSLILSVTELDVLAGIFNSDPQCKKNRQVNKQLISLINVLRQEILNSKIISIENKNKFELLFKSFYSQKPDTKLQFTPPSKMIEKRILIHLENFINGSSKIDKDLKSVLVMFDMFKLNYEEMSSLYQDLKHLNNNLPTEDKLDIEAFLSISQDFYKNYKKSDGRAFRNAFAHENYEYSEDNEEVTIYFQNRGKEEKYSVSIDKFSAMMKEYLQLMFLIQIAFHLHYTLYFIMNAYPFEL